MKINAVIMAGGAGSRLWPLSKESCPKQFIKLGDEKSLFQQTILRCVDFNKITVITNHLYLDLVTEQLSQLAVRTEIIIEPEAKGTAPCAILASLTSKEDEVVILLPSDHQINLLQCYLDQIKEACKLAANNRSSIILLGIKPNSPHTGFGYIKRGKKLQDGVRKVLSFIEKPTMEKATEYYISPEYFWNSGIFVFNANFMRDIAQEYNSKMFSLTVQSLVNATNQDIALKLCADTYSRIDSDSVDKAFIERIPGQILLLEAEFSWQDMGSWDAMWRISAKDTNENSLKGNVIANKVKNSYVFSKDKLTAVIGLENVVVVNTQNATLVADRKHSEELRDIVREINDNKIDQQEVIKELYDSWGSYKVISEHEKYNVFNLTINPGQQFSANQIRAKLANIVMVNGSAEIIISGEKKSLKQNDTIIIAADEDYTIYNNTEASISLVAIKSA